MSRRRRHCCAPVKPVQARKLDQPAILFRYTQESASWREWTYRTVSLRKALEMLAAGEADLVERKTENGLVTMFKESKPSRAAGPSPCTLTLKTLQAVAQRALHCPLSGGERAQIVKYMLWPFIGDTLAVAVRPKVTERERRAAASLFEECRNARKTDRHTGFSETRAMYFEPEPEQDAA
jgi:hypothetical protein